MNKKLAISLLALIVVAVALAVIFLPKTGSTPGTDDTDKTSSSSSSSSDTTPTPIATTTVAIDNFAFSPGTITVKVGDTVTWTNKDSSTHTVTADTASDTAPSSDDLKQGATYSFTFTKAGTYKYHCDIHEQMTGTVVVTE